MIWHPDDDSQATAGCALLVGVVMLVAGVVWVLIRLLTKR